MSKHFVLIGLPGSGKSTIGMKLAKKQGRAFVDLDCHIEAKMKMSIKAIFEQYGEATFRQIEWEAFQDVLTKPPSYIAVGGGLVYHAVKNGYSKPPETYIIYLNPPLKRLSSQLSRPNELAKRPLLTLGNQTLMARLMELKAERAASYIAWTDEEWLNY